MAKQPPKTPQRRARSAAELRRPAPSKAGRRLILIVCEGDQTEHRYFDAIRTAGSLTTVSIEIAPDAGQALAVVERARTLRRLRRQQIEALPYDEIWCVFDREARNEPASFPRAVALATREKFGLAISNPSFEYWYLLHFTETNRPYQDADDLLADLRRHLPGYEKNHALFARLHPQTSLAGNRADRLYERHPDRETDAFPNPSTLVQRLVRQLLDL
ncbi:RloB domain-containing protein [Chloroflexales bacterium ZM16-3]|nr:RloB domain-containing protein [Chloroflexales bacterium ZM16-3]